MNINHILMIVLASGLFLISCKSAQEKDATNSADQNKTEQSATIDTSLLIGSWIDQSPSALHFTLFADGTAQSDNMATLLYRQWYVKDNQLFLVAESIGNKVTSIDTTAYSVQELNDSVLTIKNGDLILNYKKASKTAQRKDGETSSAQNSKTLEGRLTWGHEVRTFKPCDDDQTFWIADKTGELKELYAGLTAGKKPYTPIFAKLEVVDKGKAKEGFPADYESVYEVVRILKTRDTSGKDCQ